MRVKAVYTVEAAIVMLADTVEAAVRSIQEPTQDKISQMIRKLVRGKMEDGQLVLNEESLRKMLQARKEQLAIESAVSYLDRIREAAQLGETERLKELIDATETLGKSTWDLVYAQLAAMKAEGLISDEQYDKILETIERLRELSKITD
ncbi:MAG: hypothetical protein J6Z06_05540, partial [Lachnospiraceae bacterium]|nr:hypothetical protein [Lachnospiraceae bacterium]